MFLLSLLATALLGLAVVLVVRAIALPRMHAAEQVESIALYGYQAAAPPAAVSVVDWPAMAGLAQVIGGALSRRAGTDTGHLRRILVSAGFYRLTPHVLLGYRAIAAVACALLLLLLSSGGSFLLTVVWSALAGVFGWFVPVGYVQRVARHRMEQIDLGLPDLIDLMVVTVEAGMTLSASMQLASSKSTGPLADELRLTLQEQRMGRSVNQSLLGMLSRCDTPNVRSFVRSVTQGESLGVPIGTIMRNLADEMRKRRRAHAEKQAQKAPVKIMFPLVFLILPAFFITILVPPIMQTVQSFGS